MLNLKAIYPGRRQTFSLYMLIPPQEYCLLNIEIYLNVSWATTSLFYCYLIIKHIGIIIQVDIRHWFSPGQRWTCDRREGRLSCIIPPQLYIFMLELMCIFILAFTTAWTTLLACSTILWSCTQKETRLSAKTITNNRAWICGWNWLSGWDEYISSLYITLVFRPIIQRTSVQTHQETCLSIHQRLVCL